VVTGASESADPHSTIETKSLELLVAESQTLAPVTTTAREFEKGVAGMTRLELAIQLIEGQPAFHFAFIPM